MGDSMNQPENLDSPTVLLRRLHHWRMAFFGLVIFAAGLTTGSAATLVAMRHRAAEIPPPVERAHQMMLGRIMPRLDLSPQQAEQVGPILRKYMQRLDGIREKGREQITKELQAMDDEMSAVLTPEQQELWRDLMLRLPGDFPRGPGRGGPGPKGPFGPRGGGRGRLQKSMEGAPQSPNDPARQN